MRPDFGPFLFELAPELFILYLIKRKDMADRSTIFQRLNKVLGGGVSDASSAKYTRNVRNYSSLGANDVIYTTNSREDYENKLSQMRQQRMLARQWKRAQYHISNNSLANMTEVQMMYREADMMDLFPEVGAALDLYMEESTYCKPNGLMVNVLSKSERIKNIIPRPVRQQERCQAARNRGYRRRALCR